MLVTKLFQSKTCPVGSIRLPLVVRKMSILTRSPPKEQLELIFDDLLPPKLEKLPSLSRNQVVTTLWQLNASMKSIGLWSSVAHEVGYGPTA